MEQQRPDLDEQPVAGGETSDRADAWPTEANTVRTLLEQVLTNLTDLIVIVDKAGRITYLNDQAALALDQPGRQLVGQSLWDRLAAINDAALARQLQGALAAERDLVFDHYHAALGRWLKIRLFSSPAGLTILATDITARRTADRNREFLTELATQVGLLSEPEAVIAATTTALAQHLACTECQFCLVEPAGAGYAIQPLGGVGTTTSGIRSAVITDLIAADLHRTLAAGEPVVIADIDPLLPSSRPTAEPCPPLLRSYLLIPYLRAGAWQALLAVGCAEPRNWPAEDLTLGESVLRRVWPLVERAHVQAALRTSEANYRILFEHASDAIFIANDDRIYVDANAAACALSGYSRAELIGKSINDLTPPDDLSRLDQDRSRLLHTSVEHQSRIGEWHLLRKDGRTIPVEVSARQLPDGRWQAFVRDISERRRNEQNSQFLSQLSIQIRLVADADALMTTAVDLLGNHLGLTRCHFAEIDRAADRYAAHHMWGEEASMHTGEYRLSALFSPGMVDQAGLGQSLVVNDTRQEQATAELAADYAERGIRAFVVVPVVRDGAWVAALGLAGRAPRNWREDELMLAETVAAWVWPAVERARSLEALRESEQRVRLLNATLERQVEERTAELQRSNRELDQFAYVASHDLKAPLRGVQHLAEWILQDAADYLPAPSREHLEKLRGRVKRMETLLDDLLAYSRAVRQRHPPELVDVGALVQDVVDLHAPPPGFVVTSDAPLPTLLTERAALTTVLRNLIGNAIKHHDRPHEGRVRIAATVQEDAVTFAVADNGPGIDRAFHSRIFEMFQTLQPRDQLEGSGIGLTVVKNLVETRGGSVWLDSAVGCGATFFFSWPQGQIELTDTD